MDRRRLIALGALGALVGCQSIAGLTDRSRSPGSSGHAGQDAVAGGLSEGGASEVRESSEPSAGRSARIDHTRGGVPSEAGAGAERGESVAAGGGSEMENTRGGTGGMPTGGGAAVEGGIGGAEASGAAAGGFETGGVGTGGAATGGVELGGTEAGGGAASGGAATGGTSTGGAATGGAARGGAPAGGRATGGVATGGAATGGTATGGTGGAARGGAPAGGRATGGASIGGAAAGGAASGGASSGGATGVVFPAKFVGNTDTRGTIRSDFSTYWDQFSPENAGQWGSVQSSSASSFNWSLLDAMYSYCEAMHIPFKQHAFVGGTQAPSWVDEGNAESAVRKWMSTFCDRYRGVAVIDVVDEPPPHTTPSFKDAIGGDGTSGWDWIANLFTWAREACPKAVLVLNDYDNIELSSGAHHTVDIVNAIQSLGAPIDAVGCQAHGTADVDTATLRSNLDLIVTGTGLPVFITEYDLNIADDEVQAQVMREQFTMFWQDEDVKGITLWGYIVGSTSQPYTGLMQSDGTERPAMTWLVQFLGRG
jgi:endo-1,4-beta-xylanase